MAKKKISNGTIFFITILAIVVFVGIKTYIIYTKENEKNLTYALESKIQYYSKRCYLEENCENEITIKDLYDKGYIKEELIDQITKEVIDKNTKISIDEKGNATINWEK